MTTEWAVIMLHQSEESVADEVLEDSLKSASKDDIEVFIPSLTFKDKRGSYNYSLFDGYVFVRGCADYTKLSNSPYVSTILTRGNGRIAYVSNAEVEQMRSQLLAMVPSDFKVGQDVVVEGGLFKGLRGKVMGLEAGEKLVVEVYMPMGSLTKLTCIPQMFARHLTPDEQNTNTQ
jgi:transcription antitermination factor NusG